jgi:hypothetical protein
MFKSTSYACAKTGMLVEHARCFQQVADSTRCVISSRSVGIYSTGLIRENYASKGFWVKAKSCDWGPMAGFVLSDARMSKVKTREAMEQQRGAITEGFAHGATERPLFITDARRKLLERRGPDGLNRITRVGGSVNEMIYSATPTGGKAMKFVLRREVAPGGEGQQLWAVYYHPDETPLTGSLGPKGGSLAPVMGMVHPNPHSSVANTYRAVMTGDYDLWGVFPRAAEFNDRPPRIGPPVRPGTPVTKVKDFRPPDYRPVPGSTRFKVSMKTFAATEVHGIGNISARVAAIKDQLNVAISPDIS